MTDKQFRSWYENKVRGAAARSKYVDSPKRFRFTVPALIADLEAVLKEAKHRAKTMK
ncbi:MAG TPA: hypothetical protein VKB38_13145 [Terracidiphilus sp.]|nr:hypothetical protein [Terracidiphilus sp.]